MALCHLLNIPHIKHYNLTLHYASRHEENFSNSLVINSQDQKLHAVLLFNGHAALSIVLTCILCLNTAS
jgi:hypothetical protein